MANTRKLPAIFSFKEIDVDEHTSAIECQLKADGTYFRAPSVFASVRGIINRCGGFVKAYSNPDSVDPQYVSFLVRHEGDAFKILNSIKSLNIINYDEIKQPLSDLGLREFYSKPKIKPHTNFTLEDLGEAKEKENKEDKWPDDISFLNH